MKKRKKILNNKLIKRITALFLIIILLLTGFYLYVTDYYQADKEAIKTFAPTIEVNKEILEDNTIVYSSDTSHIGLIFYPGGKVEYTAYEPLMELLAFQGIFCALIEMPFNLAVFDINAATEIQKLYPEIKSWYIGGHSLGGAMAATHIEKNINKYKGLILLGAYSNSDLSKTNLKVLSIYGSEDIILNHNKYEANKENLPKEFKEYIIEGGCHSYFGMYGEQKGDGIPLITNEEQINITANIIKEYILN